MAPKRYVVIVNPSGGTRRGWSILKSVESIFAAAHAQLDIQPTRHAGHARELAQQLSLENCAGILVIGGDGSLHEVVNGLMLRSDPARVPLGLIPAGSGNTVAEHLGCLDPREAARRIVAGQLHPLDVARVATAGTTDYCVNIIGWGSAVDINHTAERLRWLGPSRYTLAALGHIVRARQRRARLTLDGRVIEDEFSFIVGCNTQFTGKGMKLAPAAAMDDGLIDLVLVRHASRWQIAALFKAVFDGSHVTLPWVEIHRVRSFAIESATADTLNLDGELKGTTPVQVDMVPAGLRIFV
jgi:YegS/Rv2252/BmrU family lipid kinase